MKKPLFFLSVIITCSVYAQQTGSFTMNTTFTKSDYMFNRDLYFYVPTTYDLFKPYPLIVGFRGGPHTNAGQFRDELQPLSDSLNAIIVCPENIAHFNTNEDQVKLLYKYTLDTVTSIYNIHEDSIYLTGLSFGGRHAVIVAMDTNAGPIPDLRGVIPFAAGTNSENIPDYGVINEFAPACVCIGLNDANNFITISNTLHNDIQNNGGESILNEVPGVGHTTAFSSFPAEWMECYNFVEGTYSSPPNSIQEGNDINVSIYPNPNSGIFNIVGTQQIDLLEVIDAQGRLVKRLDNLTGNIDLSDLEKGSYTLVSHLGYKRQSSVIIISE